MYFCTLKLVFICLLIFTAQLGTPHVHRVEDDQKWMKLVNDCGNAFGQHATPLPLNRKITDITIFPREGEEYVGLVAVRVTYSLLSDTSADLLKSMNVYPRRMLQVYFIRDVYGCSRLPVCRIP